VLVPHQQQVWCVICMYELPACVVGNGVGCVCERWSAGWGVPHTGCKWWGAGGGQEMQRTIEMSAGRGGEAVASGC